LGLAGLRWAMRLPRTASPLGRLGAAMALDSGRVPGWTGLLDSVRLVARLRLTGRLGSLALGPTGL
jgi:hypothetical protein